MQNTTFLKFSLLTAVMSLSACVSKEEQARQDHYNTVYQAALTKIGPEHEKVCIEAFKENMNDPSSLQILGHQVYSQNFEGRALYYIPMRAKNGFGALVKSEIDCQYEFNGEQFVLHSAYQRTM